MVSQTEMQKDIDRNLYTVGEAFRVLMDFYTGREEVAEALVIMALVSLRERKESKAGGNPPAPLLALERPKAEPPASKRVPQVREPSTLQIKTVLLAFRNSPYTNSTFGTELGKTLSLYNFSPRPVYGLSR